VHHGLSPKASAENALVGKRLTALSSSRWKDSRAAVADSDRNGAAPLDEDSFLSMVSSMESSIEALKRSAVTFDPNSEVGAALGKEGSPVARGGRPGGRGIGADEQEGAGGMSRSERVAMYKMCRKIEEEMPPLDRSFLEGSALPPREQGLVRWNATPAAIGRFEPEAKMERMKTFSTTRARRGMEVAKVRSAKMEESQSQWSSHLARKMQQGQRALERSGRRSASTVEAMYQRRSSVASLASEASESAGLVQE